MTAAASSNPRDFRTFRFLFANALLHEIGAHLLIPYLIGDEISQAHPYFQGITPPQYQPQLVDGLDGYNSDRILGGGQAMAVGESGRYLEQLLLGGCLDYYCDTSKDDSQPGDPYLATKKVDYRISETSITETLKFNFSFPYTPSPPAPIPQSTKESMGKRQKQAEENSSNLMDRNLVAYKPSHSQRVTVKVGEGAAVRKFPFEPRRRAEVVG